MDEKVRSFIIAELGKERNRRDVIMDLCMQHNLDWKQAEELVRSVELFDSQQIAKRQSPLLIILGAGVLLAGTALTITTIIFFWDLFNGGSLAELANPSSIYYMGIGLVTGIAMIAGGIIGLRNILGDMF